MGTYWKHIFPLPHMQIWKHLIYTLPFEGKLSDDIHDVMDIHDIIKISKPYLKAVFL